MVERITIDVLDEGGAPRSRFINAENAIESRKRAATRAWRSGVLVGAVGASAAYGVARWLGDRR
jgi:hypothetical protein